MKKPLVTLALVFAAACSRTETAQQSASAPPPPVMPEMQMSHADTAAADAPILAVKQLYSPAAAEAYVKAAEVPDRLLLPLPRAHAAPHVEDVLPDAPCGGVQCVSERSADCVAGLEGRPDGGGFAGGGGSRVQWRAAAAEYVG